ncbi:hypothetical protein A3F07_03135 [candidate division WWE3 bacterium RIFCSPHIGHO2_12_FULL_38_15]|uniref:DNA-binding response regulator n=1 Tax=candidate division WWE3 bacterium RIFCSPHIGHO2_02_FULL_38_14 TaxID=1802620 RepID=A0A1F4VAK3_UNCKA|nr:MAG: hypothetical protein A2793_04215 [candidate division WWE3 bacterium RIFCSPHIGHO2_01_FULL_38_45]OGC49464.1 MAG: hypothetical protein A3F07_03135 [candidate division WWE3 bacterium RIFCSPHIGHO2_12_FULL_38_15]OGC52726.1 MAG: hypothetical protein A3B64_00940 [candidate division WWE3 bacterium RIFCSPLOWO2_01_FULL_37_24]OGC53920.1 MAG: hypothetical protein A3D91_03995 [candidate division WWE3 bacterium RIFCSPHIGHO2_02_FULL_38_14]HLB52072.1 response regulator transcription factor [Patescibacte
MLFFINKKLLLDDKNRQMRLLIIDQDCEFTQTLNLLLKCSYIVDIENSGKDGLHTALTINYNTILINLILNDLDGVSICTMLRNKQIDTPIIMMINKGEKTSPCAALDNGADDCIEKPFDIQELNSRIRAVMRRKVLNHYTDIVRIKNIEVDLRNKQVFKDKKNIKLRKKEYQILEYMIVNKNTIVTKDALIESLWEVEDYRESNTLEVHISCLRKALQIKNLIITVHGIGYRIEK